MLNATWTVIPSEARNFLSFCMQSEIPRFALQKDDAYVLYIQ
jgi:hypothetical protein